MSNQIPLLWAIIPKKVHQTNPWELLTNHLHVFIVLCMRGTVFFGGVIILFASDYTERRGHFSFLYIANTMYIQQSTERAEKEKHPQTCNDSTHPVGENSP